MYMYMYIYVYIYERDILYLYSIYMHMKQGVRTAYMVQQHGKHRDAKQVFPCCLVS